MTLTPAIIAALDNYDEAAIKSWNADSSLRSTVKEQQTARTRLRECRDALLSVVAAEEGRKCLAKRERLAQNIREMWLTSDNFARDLNALCEQLRDELFLPEDIS